MAGNVGSAAVVQLAKNAGAYVIASDVSERAAFLQSLGADEIVGAQTPIEPIGAQVHSGKSKTLQDTGTLDAIMDPNHYDALRYRYFKMDRKTQAHEIRRLIAAPDYMLSSLNAITEDGILVASSATSG